MSHLYQSTDRARQFGLQQQKKSLCSRGNPNIGTHLMRGRGTKASRKAACTKVFCRSYLRAPQGLMHRRRYLCTCREWEICCCMVSFTYFAISAYAGHIYSTYVIRMRHGNLDHVLWAQRDFNLREQPFFSQEDFMRSDRVFWWREANTPVRIWLMTSLLSAANQFRFNSYEDRQIFALADCEHNSSA